MIEVMVLDQVLARTSNLTVTLAPSGLTATLDETTAARLQGDRVYVVNFTADSETHAVMTAALKRMFRDIPGLTITTDTAS